MFNKSLERLRATHRPEFNVEELFKLHRRCEVIARCKVQAGDTQFLVMLVIGGETVRAQYCDTADQVNAIAAHWRTELAAQHWNPCDPTVVSEWVAQHQQWRVSVRSASGYCCGFAISDEGIAIVKEQLTAQCAQTAIVRELTEKYEHQCSDCEPWALNLRPATAPTHQPNEESPILGTFGSAASSRSALRLDDDEA